MCILLRTPRRGATQIGSVKWSVLAGSTLAFTVCFAVWMMFAVIGIPIKKTLGASTKRSSVCSPRCRCSPAR